MPVRFTKVIHKLFTDKSESEIRGRVVNKSGELIALAYEAKPLPFRAWLGSERFLRGRFFLWYFLFKPYCTHP